MINCPKCGADNMIGAIFCRTCGAKLNIDELRPESFAEMEKVGVAQRIGKILGRVAILIVLLGLVGVLITLFLPARNLITGDLSEKDVAALKAKYQRMQQPSRKQFRFTFTSTEATALVNDLLGLRSFVLADPNHPSTTPPPAARLGLVPECLSLEFTGTNQVRVVLKSMLLGILPVYNTVEGSVDCSGPGTVRFAPVSASMGRMRFSPSLHSVVIGRFDAVLEGQGPVDDFKKAAAGLEITQNSAKVIVKYQK